LPALRPNRLSFGVLNAGVATLFRRWKVTMQLKHSSTEFNGRRIAVEMMILMAQTLLLGVAVAVVVAAPVIVVAILAP
jgi:hypothetical protein